MQVARKWTIVIITKGQDGFSCKLGGCGGMGFGDNVAEGC